LSPKAFARKGGAHRSARAVFFQLVILDRGQFPFRILLVFPSAFMNLQ
jgi:hypothetical protein